MSFYKMYHKMTALSSVSDLGLTASKRSATQTALFYNLQVNAILLL